MQGKCPTSHILTSSPTTSFGQTTGADVATRDWEKEVEKEEKKTKETAGASVGKGTGTPKSPRAPLGLRRKGWEESSVGLKVPLHPLLTRWALWFSKNDRSRAWRDSLQLITKIDTVEDFWAVYSNIKLASRLSTGCDYALFRDGIEPMWEDSMNKKGGRWLVCLARQQRHTDLDRLWLETLLCLIGESFAEHGPEVCGAVINIRTKRDKIAVWTKEAENQEGVLHIGRIYKERLRLSSTAIIGYQAHVDTAVKSSFLPKNKFMV
ncbi:eukaryotic translation initiation factor 4E type 1B [Sorex fumeus]|uniref:eukaryotic translation initiation factor 4E type 1B n=1 Tax=Sorex fumeus TaxID=62283 RepID=UPI0024AD8A86|nr:eukaryotic translation initiation factor 4E type 1B [Sorex fumeus]